MHVRGCNGVVAVFRACRHGDSEGERDEEDGDEQADAQVVPVGLRGREDNEGQEEEGAEDNTEDGEIVWDAKVGSPVGSYLSVTDRLPCQISDLEDRPNPASDMGNNMIVLLRRPRMFRARSTVLLDLRIC